MQRDDRLSFSTVNEEKKPSFRRKGATYRKAFIQTVSDISEPTMSSSFTDNALPFLPKDSTVLFVITDCLESIESWRQFLQKLPKFAGDIRILQVVTRDEVDPSYGGDIQLEDVETSEQVNVSISTRVLEAYHQERKIHQQQIELLCHKYGIKIQQVSAEEGISHIMFHQLLRANWVQ